MARRKHRNGIQPAPRATAERTIHTTYDAWLSSKRLQEKNGFHPKVTSLSLQEIFQKWMKMSKTMNQRTGASTGKLPPAGMKTRCQTLAPFVFSPEFMRENRRYLDRLETREAKGLAQLFTVDNVAVVLTENIFSLGARNAQSLALSSKEMWMAVIKQANIWEYISGTLQVPGRSGVFAVVSSQYTIGDFLKARDKDPRGLFEWNLVANWREEAFGREDTIHNTIWMAHSDARNPDERTFAENLYGYKATMAIGYLESLDNIWGQRQFVDAHHEAVFKPQQQLLGNRLMQMVEQIYAQRNSLKVLHFEKTAFLDRRILAIILRGCPHVTMLGIYDCPLIHFGDVICLLDLIWEINLDREAKGFSKIKAFDFYPRYEVGMEWNGEHASTYGLSWNPIQLDITQDGFYLIILKAFMKAQYMRLNLLFDKDQAFRDYLFRVPNLPFGVLSFLDALYRLMDLTGRGAEVASERKKALYDLLLPVRLYVERFDDRKQDQDWYRWEMEKGFYFCASCGYSMPEAFFTSASRACPPELRPCAGCILQARLDGQKHALLQDQRACLKELFPLWNGRVFNQDAPVSVRGNSVIRLKTTKTIPSPPPPIQADSSGRIRQPQYIKEDVRGERRQEDSLQNLPTLVELACNSQELWSKFHLKCRQLDVFCRTTWLLIDKGPWDLDMIKGLAPLGKPDHHEEVQRKHKGKGFDCHSFEYALNVHFKKVKAGLQPGGKPDKVVNKATYEKFLTDEEADFW